MYAHIYIYGNPIPLIRLITTPEMAPAPGVPDFSLPGHESDAARGWAPKKTFV